MTREVLARRGGTGLGVTYVLLGAILLGATLGMPATIWTIAIPLVAIAVIVLTLLSHGTEAPTAPV